MMNRIGWAGTLVVSALVLSGLAAAGHSCWAQEGEFAIALEAAKKAAGAEPLKSYLAGPFGELFGARHIQWLNDCAAKTNRTPDDLIELLVTVDGAGNVEAIRYQPHSTTIACFADTVKATKFAAPPQPHLVVPAVIHKPK
jgi:hypothetical protein